MLSQLLLLLSPRNIVLTVQKSTERQCTNEGLEIGVGEPMKLLVTMETPMENLPSVNQASGLEERFQPLKSRHARKTPSQTLHVVPLHLPPHVHISPMYTNSLGAATLRTPTIHTSVVHTPTRQNLPLLTPTQVRCADVPRIQVVHVVQLLQSSPLHTSLMPAWVWEAHLS